MPLNPINGSDTPAAAWQKNNANEQYLEAQITTVSGDVATETAARIAADNAEAATRAAADTALSNRVTSLEQDPDVRRFDYDPANSDGLNFAFFGGRYEDLHGVSQYVSDGVAAIVAGTNYVELDYDTGAVSANQIGFTDGRLKLWVAVSNGVAIVGNPTDFRPQQIQPGVTIGLGYNPSATTGLTYAYRSGWVRSATGMLPVAGGTHGPLVDNTLNYVEIDDTGTVSSNTIGWSLGLAPLATVNTSGGAITGVDDSVRGAVITSIGGGGGGGFFDAATWMMT